MEKKAFVTKEKVEEINCIIIHLISLKAGVSHETESIHRRKFRHHGSADL